jgi:glycosyltransferase involved in cell wall biosynthesis
VRGVKLARNFGQHQAITAGLRESRGAWVVVMDCDLQDRPEEIPRLYAKAHEGRGNECVLARRQDRKDMASKKFSSWAFYKIFNYLTDLQFDGTVANFSIISRRITNQLIQMPESVRFYGGFLQWMGFNDCFVDVPHDPRFAGKSSYTLIRLLRFSSDIILAYSDKPLRLCVMAGFGIASASIVGGMVFLLRALFYGYGAAVTGWASLIISIWFSTGAIIFTLGILGLYIARIFSEVKRRPHYVIRTRSPKS